MKAILRSIPVAVCGLTLGLSLTMLTGCGEMSEQCKKVVQPICDMCGADSEACTKLTRSAKINPSQCEEKGAAEAMELMAKLAKDNEELKKKTCEDIGKQ